MPRIFRHAIVALLTVLATASTREPEPARPASAVGSELIFSTVVDASATGRGLHGMDVGPDGSIYLCGASHGGSRDDNDSFVTKLQPNGLAEEWSILVGGSPNPDPSGRFWVDYCDDVDYGEGGVLHIVGITSAPDFPILGGWDGSFNGENDVYYARIDAGTGALLYSTFLGGSGREGESDDAFVSATADGGAVVAFATPSEDIETIGGVQSSAKGFRDVVVYRIDASGTPSAITYLGTDQRDALRARPGLDADGNVFIGSFVTAAPSDFPFTNAFQNEFNGGTEAWVAKLTPDLSSIVYASPLGGSGGDAVIGLAVTPQGSLVVSGSTTSADLAVVDAFQTEFGGGGVDAYLALIGPGGSLDALTYLGGDASDAGSFVAAGDDGRIYVTGTTRSEGVFAIDAVQDTPGGLTDVFIQVFEPDLQTSLFATYLGGSATDGSDVDGHGPIVQPRASGDMVVAGPAREGFPVVNGNGVGFDYGYFVARMQVELPDIGGGGGQLAAEQIPLVFVTGVTTDQITEELTIVNSGSETVSIQSIDVEPSSFYGLASGFPDELGPGAETTIMVSFQPPGAGIPDVAIEGEVIVTSNASNAEFAIPLKSVIVVDQNPHGLAIDEGNPTPDVEPARSEFLDIRVFGSGLADIDGASFDPPDHIIVEEVAGSDTAASISVAVEHGATLGLRNLTLSSTTADYEVDVSSIIGLPLIITRAKTTFNQAIDASLQPGQFKDVLVADKFSAVRVQLDDPLLLGTDFTGTLVTDFGPEEPDQEIIPYLYKESYSRTDVSQGYDYLSLPFAFTAGEMDVSYTLEQLGGGLTIAGPLITREFRASRSLNIVALSYRLRDGDTVLEPVSVESIPAIFDPLLALLPLSVDSLRVRFLLEHRDLPDSLTTYGGTRIPVWETATRSDNSVGPIMTEQGRTEILSRLGYEVIVQDIDLVAAFLPQQILDLERADGSIQSVAGLASRDNRVVFINGRPETLTNVMAHEIGHVIGSIFQFESLARPRDLGDEYERGLFKCRVNPPVAGLRSRNGEPDCTDSPVVASVGGDEFGTYSDSTAFDASSLFPTASATRFDPPIVFYNFMGTAGDFRWPNRATYNEFVKALVPTSQELELGKTQSTEAVAVQGQVFQDGTGVIRSATRTSVQQLPDDEAGEYRVELSSSNGGQAVSFSTFDAEFYAVAEPPYPTDTYQFTVYLPLEGVSRDAYDRIVLSREGVGTLAEFDISTESPEVSNIVGVQSEDGSGDVILTWDAGDSEGDDLRYGVFYFNDDGQLAAVASGLDERSYRWQTVADGPNDDPRVVIIATDGFNEGRAEADLGFGIGVGATRETPIPVPTVLAVASNYPNPFAGRTTISFSTANAAELELHVYDLLGRRVQSRLLGRVPGGVADVEFDARGLIPGSYFYVIQGDAVRITGRMIVLDD